MKKSDTLKGWALASPLLLVLLAFLLLPIAMIVVVSFWQATEFAIVPEVRGRQAAPAFRSGRQAAMNSFHLRTMYWFSSMTEFQQATAPMRS